MRELVIIPDFRHLLQKKNVRPTARECMRDRAADDSSSDDYNRNLVHRKAVYEMADRRNKSAPNCGDVQLSTLSALRTWRILRMRYYGES